MTNLLYDVAYADTDAGGIVYHGKYIEIAERSRNLALSASGIPFHALNSRFGVNVVVRSVHGIFHRPSFLGDRLELTSGLTALTAARAFWRTTVRRDTAVICDIEAETATLDNETGALRPMPDSLLGFFDQISKLPAMPKRVSARTAKYDEI